MSQLWLPGITFPSPSVLSAEYAGQSGLSYLELDPSAMTLSVTCIEAQILSAWSQYASPPHSMFPVGQLSGRKSLSVF
jgi:hypothetical protein